MQGYDYENEKDVEGSLSDLEDETNHFAGPFAYFNANGDNIYDELGPVGRRCNDDPAFADFVGENLDYYDEIFETIKDKTFVPELTAALLGVAGAALSPRRAHP